MSIVYNRGLCSVGPKCPKNEVKSPVVSHPKQFSNAGVLLQANTGLSNTLAQPVMFPPGAQAELSSAYGIANLLRWGLPDSPRKPYEPKPYGISADASWIANSINESQGTSIPPTFYNSVLPNVESPVLAGAFNSAEAIEALLFRNIQGCDSSKMLDGLQLHSLLGVGSMGTVYNASMLGQRVVVKVRYSVRVSVSVFSALKRKHVSSLLHH